MLHDEGRVGRHRGRRQPSELGRLGVEDDGVEALALPPSWRVSQHRLVRVAAQQEQGLLRAPSHGLAYQWDGWHDDDYGVDGDAGGVYSGPAVAVLKSLRPWLLLSLLLVPASLSNDVVLLF